jgi:photosystem II stability/assembly factor-like uncharacterized protein
MSTGRAGSWVVVGGLAVLTLATAIWSVANAPARDTPASRIISVTTTTAATSTPTTSLPPSAVPTLPAPAATTGTAWQVSLAYPAVPKPDEAACPSASICYAAGTNSSDSGEVLRTSDAGATWRAEVLPSGVRPVTGISCPSVSDCFATEGGGILVTHNSGRSWTSRGPFADSSLAAISCPSVTTCYVVGSLLVLGTTDGGATWTEQSAPTNQALYRSGLPLLAPFDAITCPSTTVCFAMGSGSYMVTRDAGRTWTDDEGLVNGRAVRQGGGYGPFGDSITCPSTTMCVTNGTVETKSDGPRSEISLTTDSGATWVTERIPKSIGVSDVSCLSTSRCFALGGGGATRATEFGAILASSNGGKSWDTSRYSPGPQGPGTIACTTRKTCMIIEQGSNGVVETTDAGRVWSTRSWSAGIFGFNDVACPSTTSCYAATGNGILATRDSGSSWQWQTLPANALGASAITCPSVSTCYAVIGTTTQNVGEVVATTNSGSTWTVVTSRPVSDITCPSTTTCYAIGVYPSAGGSPEVTTDSGRTWKVAPSLPDNAELTAVGCGSVSSCYALGMSGGLATTDSGNTWTSEILPAGIEPVLEGMACATAITCVAVGQNVINCVYLQCEENGTLAAVVTRDGGARWNGYAVPANDSLNAVACPSEGACYAVGFLGSAQPYLGGGSGVIVSSNDLGVDWSNQPLPPLAGELTSISCPSVTTCFAVGEGVGDVGGLILKMTPSQN